MKNYLSTAPCPHHALWPNPLPVSEHPIAFQGGGIKNLVYQAFCSKITPALQASVHNLSLLHDYILFI